MEGKEDQAEEILLQHLEFIDYYRIKEITLEEFPFFYKNGSH